MDDALQFLDKPLTPQAFTELIRAYSPKRILLVRGKASFEACGAKQLCEPAFASTGANVVEFFDFEENPKIEDVERGLTLFRDNAIDLVVAIGGGSVLDMAKLIRFFAAYAGEIKEGEYLQENDCVPLLAFPTTSGTGAECTHFAVCYKNRKKYSLTHADVRPTKAYLIPEWTHACSPYLTACVGFDAFAQAVESCWSVRSTDTSREYALRAISLLYPNLEACVKNPTPELRRKIAEGAYWAGRAIDISFTTAAHAFSYGLTTYLGFPHGRAVASSLGYFFDQNLNISEDNCNDPRGVEFVRARMQELCGILKIESGVELSRWARALFGQWLKNVPPSEEEWTACLASVNLSRLSNNPTKILKNPNVNDFIW